MRRAMEEPLALGRRRRFKRAESHYRSWKGGHSPSFELAVSMPQTFQPHDFRVHIFERNRGERGRPPDRSRMGSGSESLVKFCGRGDNSPLRARAGASLAQQRCSMTMSSNCGRGSGDGEIPEERHDTVYRLEYVALLDLGPADLLGNLDIRHSESA